MIYDMEQCTNIMNKMENITQLSVIVRSYWREVRQEVCAIKVFWDAINSRQCKQCISITANEVQ